MVGLFCKFKLHKVIVMDLSVRKTMRLQNYNYSENGAYYVTICTKNKAKVLGQVVGYGACDIPFTKLSTCGKIVEKHITLLNNKYDYLSIDKYVIMPNHIHLLISITSDNNVSVCRKPPNPTNELIPKFVSLFKRYCNLEYGQQIWQRSYYDHIIRDEKDYLTKWNYIDGNPSKWENDDYYIK